MDKETKSLIKGYLEKAGEKLKVASSLLEDGAYDDAVSRAYYAAFHAATAVLLTEGLAAETHRGLLNMFGLHFVKTGKIEKKYGKYLANLKDDRESGDYEAFSAIDKETAETAVSEATDFLGAMKRFLEQFLV